MSGYEIHIHGKRRAPMQKGDRPAIRISPEAYNTLLEIGEESIVSIKDIESILIVEASKHVVYDRQEV